CLSNLMNYRMIMNIILLNNCVLNCYCKGKWFLKPSIFYGFKVNIKKGCGNEFQNGNNQRHRRTACLMSLEKRVNRYQTLWVKSTTSISKIWKLRQAIRFCFSKI